MNDKININGINYDQLGTIKVNNREYVFGLNNNDLEFFEKVAADEGTTLVSTNKDLTLAGNAGTSLTRLNERIVMTHLADSIKSDIRNGKLTNKDAIKNEFVTAQSVVDDDPNIKKLLKGNITNLNEENFSDRAANLLTYFDSQKRATVKKNDDFDIVDGGEDHTFVSDQNAFTDRTVVNKDMYEKINQQLDEAKHQEETDPFANTIISPAFGQDMGLPTEKELEDKPTTLENASVNETSEPTFIVDKLNEEPKAPVESFMGLKDEQLTDEVIDSILTKKRDQIPDEAVKYLENLQATRALNKKEEVKDLGEKPKELVLTKPNKKAAYVDTVILCLVTQLSIFGLLIFVLLLIK